MRWDAGGFAAVTLVVLCGACGVPPAPGQAPQAPPTAVSADRQRPADYARLELTEGDRVHVAGRVVAVPGRPVRLCAPVAVAAIGVAPGHEPAPQYCDDGIDVRGVDLATLSQRRAKGGAVEGTADVEGAYHAGGVSVVTQRPLPSTGAPSGGAGQGDPDVPDGPDRPPCPAPPGGWPVGGQDANIDHGPVEDYERTHPGAVVKQGSLRPSRRQVLAYVLTTGDPGPVAAALRPAYGAALCVVRSRYTRAEIERAAGAFASGSPQPRAAGVYAVGSGGLAGDEQPIVTVELVRVTPAVAALAARQALGLVRLRPWLRPVAARHSADPAPSPAS